MADRADGGAGRWRSGIDAAPHGIAAGANPFDSGHDPAYEAGFVRTGIVGPRPPPHLRPAWDRRPFERCAIRHET